MNIIIRNSVSEIGMVRDHFADFATPSVREREHIHKLCIVLDEVLTNIISHGYQDSEIHHIQVSCTIENCRLTLTFKDNGIPFNPLIKAIPIAHIDIDNPQIGGLGIKLTRNFVDEMEYRREEGFNVLHIIKIIG